MENTYTQYERHKNLSFWLLCPSDCSDDYVIMRYLAILPVIHHKQVQSANLVSTKACGHGKHLAKLSLAIKLWLSIIMNRSCLESRVIAA